MILITSYALGWITILKQTLATKNITKGMSVIDNAGERIGTVIAFRQGEGTIKTNQTDAGTISETVREALGGKKRLSAALYSRLFSEGFLYINRGVLRGTVIVYPDQIDQVAGDKITLHINRRDVVKI